MPSIMSKCSASQLLELQRVVVDLRRNNCASDEKRRQTQAEQATKLNSLRLGNLFCDVQLQFGKSSHRRVQLAAHKILLTAVSDYLLELFCAMPKLQVVSFPQLDAIGFDLFLNYAYFMRVELSVEQAARFLRIATLLRADQDCIERCAAFLRDNLTVENVLEVRQSLLSTDTSPPMIELRAQANSFIRTHVKELIEHILAHSSSSSSKHGRPSTAVTLDGTAPAATDEMKGVVRTSATNGESEMNGASSTIVVKLRLTLSRTDQLAGVEGAYRELAGLVLRCLTDYVGTSRNWSRQLSGDCVIMLALDEANHVSLVETPGPGKLAVSPSGQWTYSSLASLSNWEDSDGESKPGEPALSDAEGVQHTANGSGAEESGRVSHKSSVADSMLEMASARPSSSSRGSLGPPSVCDTVEFESTLGDCNNGGLLETCTIAVYVEADRNDRFACLALLHSKVVLMSVRLDCRKEPEACDDDADPALSVRTHNGLALHNGFEGPPEASLAPPATIFEEQPRTASRHSSSSGSLSPTRSTSTSTSTSTSHRRALTLEPLAEMADARCGHACVPLRGGRQLAALGGYNRDRCLASVELFDLAANSWTMMCTMRSARARFGACLLGDLLLACGGSDGSADLHSCEVLNIASLAFDGNDNPTACPDDSLTSRLRFEPVESMNYARSSHAVAALDDRAYAVGGNAGNTDLCVLELYDAGKDEWIVGPPLRSERSQPAVCADPQRTCLYALGGSRQGSPLLCSVERYDPREPAWHLLDCRLTAARRGAAAVCTANGLVYVVGGHSGSQALRAVDVFDPRNLCVLPVGSLNVARANVACCALSSAPSGHTSDAQGDLLMALGGFSGKQFLGSFEFYDAEAQRWSVYKPAGCGDLRGSTSTLSLKRTHDSGSQPTSMSVSMMADADACL